MISGFMSVIFLNFVFKEMTDIGPYFVALDVLVPSFTLAILIGFIVSKKYPPRAEAIKMIEKIDASKEEK